MQRVEMQSLKNLINSFLHSIIFKVHTDIEEWSYLSMHTPEEIHCACPHSSVHAQLHILEYALDVVHRPTYNVIHYAVNVRTYYTCTCTVYTYYTCSFCHDAAYTQDAITKFRHCSINNEHIYSPCMHVQKYAPRPIHTYM